MSGFDKKHEKSALGYQPGSELKVVVFGTGEASYRLTLKNMADKAFNIQAYIDNDAMRWNMPYLDSIIQSPEYLSNFKYPVIIASSSAAAIGEQLGNMGYESGRDFSAVTDLVNLSEFQAQTRNVIIDYPPDIKRRYTEKKPHEKLYKLISSARRDYSKFIEKAGNFAETLSDIPLLPPSIDYSGPYWCNPWISPMDGISIYTMLAAKNPSFYMEVGSGVSTKFARRAIMDHKLKTKIISVDPCPRNEVSQQCDQSLRIPLEKMELELFSDLNSGDIVFIDNSHRALMNSDVTVFFLEILPSLPSGVAVGIHDIFLPYDYPESFGHRLYSEQYLLAAFLIAAPEKYRVKLPVAYVNQDLELKSAALDLVKKVSNLSQTHGGAFWMDISGVSL